MDLQYTISIYIAIFSLVILAFVVWNNDLLERNKKLEFSQIFLAITVGAMSEWLGVILDGSDPAFRLLHIAAKVADHSIAPLIALYFIQVVSDSHIAKKMTVLVIGHAILEVISGFNGFIFYVDAQNRYYHGSGYWVYFAIYVGCSIYFVLKCVKFGRHYQTKDRTILVMMLCFFMFGTTIGMVLSGVRIAYLSVAIDTIIFYVYYTGIVEKTDALTGMLNRRSYESRIARAQRPMLIYYIDVDDFKSVNDTYGHQSGDACLKHTAHFIRSFFETKTLDGSCYRIGGDEFCVLVEYGERITADAIPALNAQFTQKLQEERAKDEALASVSIGYSVFDPDQTDIASAIQEADASMYANKRQKKQNEKR